MKTVWFKGHTSPEAKAKREKEIRGYKNGFDELRDVIEHNFKKKEAVRDYEQPNWVERQIAVNEYNQALRDILDLINLDKE